MPSLFEYHFKIALNTAVKSLTKECQDMSGSEDQKNFNTKIQIKTMNDVLEQINAIKLDDQNPDWQAFAVKMKLIIDEAKREVKREQKAAQGESGSEISDLLFENFGNKLLAMFGEMRKEMTSSRFQPHDKQDATNYTSTDYLTSNFYCQFINIAISYRFNKIQEKHVVGASKFTSKHISKWDELTGMVDLWNIHASNPSLSFSQYKSTIAANLASLIVNEHRIQTETGESLLGWVRGLGLSVVAKWNETPDDLRVRIPALLLRFKRDCVSKPTVLEESKVDGKSVDSQEEHQPTI